MTDVVPAHPPSVLVLRLALLFAVLVPLSACEWEGRPDGMAPNNEAEMVFEPDESYDSVEQVDLDAGEIVEPLDGTALPGPTPSTTVTRGTIPAAAGPDAPDAAGPSPQRTPRAPSTGLPGRGASDDS